MLKERTNCIRVEQNFNVDIQFVFDGHTYLVYRLTLNCETFPVGAKQRHVLMFHN